MRSVAQFGSVSVLGTEGRMFESYRSEFFNMVKFFFYFFSSVAIISAIMVIYIQNPVHAILFLILAFCNISFLMILLGAEFLGLIFIMVYVGAVAVLFLFVVMMLDIRQQVAVTWNPFDFYSMCGIFIVFVLELFFMLEQMTVMHTIVENYFLDVAYMNGFYDVVSKSFGGIFAI